MVRLLIKLAVFLGSAALGLLAAWLLLGDAFRISALGFVTAVVVFAVVQSLISPILEKLTRKYASALTGGVGVVSTFVALLVAAAFPGGLHIIGADTWVLATVIVWLVTAVGAWLLTMLLLKDRADQSRAKAKA